MLRGRGHTLRLVDFRIVVPEVPLALRLVLEPLHQRTHDQVGEFFDRDGPVFVLVVRGIEPVHVHSSHARQRGDRPELGLFDGPGTLQRQLGLPVLVVRVDQFLASFAQPSPWLTNPSSSS